jgi:ABC-2 type transport system ATP-binding protein
MNLAVSNTEISHAPLTLNGVRKAYGTKLVLDAIDLTLQPGEIFGLIGLNGVGKTTMIKIILDLVTADAGEAALFGIPARNVSARRTISYLPEKFQPSGNLLGREYLKLTQSYYGGMLDMDAAMTMAEALDLDPQALHRRVSSYSKGMGQKLGLLGAFMIDQPLAILDEPMSGLDPRARIRLKQQLMKMKSAGKTIFFSSHILADIDEICDRIAVLHDAKLIFTGTPVEFKHRYDATALEPAFLKAIS